MRKNQAVPLLLSVIFATSFLTPSSEAKENASSSKPTPAAQATATPDPKAHPADVAPTVGMTEAEVLARYGKPDYKSSVLGGNETWHYKFDKSKHYIPGSIFLKKRQGKVTFDKKTRKVIEVKWGKSRL